MRWQVSRGKRGNRLTNGTQIFMTMTSSKGLTRRALLGAFAATTVAAAPTYSNAFGLLRGAGDIRRIKMYSGRTGETLDMIYWLEGNYIKEALAEVHHFMRDWRNNPDFRKHFREYRDLNMLQQEIWFKEKVEKDPTTLMFSIKRNDDNELLGCCGFVYINWVHRHADLSLYIGWQDAYIDEEGYAEESCRLLLEYGFNELCLNKVWTEIYE